MKKVFEMTWRNKFLTTGAKSIDGMIRLLKNASERLQEMKDDGVVLDPNNGVEDDYARLIISDPKDCKEI